MTLGVIPTADIDRSWFICGPMLDKAIKNGSDPYTLEDYKNGLKAGTHQLWTWVENDKILCCAITRINTYPSTKILSLPVIGGSALKMWKEPAQKIIADWAKKNGCSEMEGYAIRKGWLRVLPNWKAVWVTIRRSL